MTAWFIGSSSEKVGWGGTTGGKEETGRERGQGEAERSEGKGESDTQGLI